MMQTETLTLTAFLEQRLAEDEADSRDALAEVPDHSWAGHVLAQCAAIRGVVELHKSYAPFQDRGKLCRTCGSPPTVVVSYPCPTLRAVAQAWVGHADWREEWSW